MTKHEITIKREWSCVSNRMLFYAYNGDDYIDSSFAETAEECENFVKGFADVPAKGKEPTTVVKTFEVEW